MPSHPWCSSRKFVGFRLQSICRSGQLSLYLTVIRLMKGHAPPGDLNQKYRHRLFEQGSNGLSLGVDHYNNRHPPTLSRGVDRFMISYSYVRSSTTYIHNTTGHSAAIITSSSQSSLTVGGTWGQDAMAMALAQILREKGGT